MVPGNCSEPPSQLEVLVVDYQATAGAPRRHLLEIGWARVRQTVTQPHACLIALPDGEQIPPAITRITLASFDRLRVLTTGLKRLIAAGAPAAVRLGVGPALDESRLASARWLV
jgi:hypothetical protein